MRCRYCQTLYQSGAASHPENAGANVHILKGARVVFGKGAHVTIRGSVEIEDGADVHVDGELTILERGTPDAIRAARERVARGE